MHHSVQRNENGHYATTVSQSITIHATSKTVWNKVSDVMGLTDWVVDAKKTEPMSKNHSGVGAVRKITFGDGSQVIEYIVGLKQGSHLSYVATSGLPLDVYHATLSILPKGKSTQVTWTTFLNSDSTEQDRFEEFLIFIDKFYEKSLQNLKQQIEK